MASAADFPDRFAANEISAREWAYFGASGRQSFPGRKVTASTGGFRQNVIVNGIVAAEWTLTVVTILTMVAVGPAAA